MKKCIVTGGAGFIGSNLVDKLIERGYNVTIIDNLSTGVKENINPKALFFNEDLAKIDSELLAGYFKDCNYVFHLAALPRIQPSFEYPKKHEEANVIATINVMLAAAKARVEKVVYSSSSSVYGDPKNLPTSETEPVGPQNPYGLQKYTAEQYCLILGKKYNIPVIAFRYFNVYGPRSFNPNNKLNAYSSAVGIFNNQAKNNQPITVTGTGKQKRDLVHVWDVAKANIMAAESNVEGEIFNVGGGVTYPIIEIAKMFSDNIKFIPERPGEADTTHCNNNKIKEMLGWEPTFQLKEGIKYL